MDAIAPPFLILGNFGPQEMGIVFIIVLLLFGAKKIPELARGLGKSMGEFKKARNEFEEEIKRAADDVELEKKSEAPPKSEAHQS